jgi:hypothetical protein
MVVVSAAAAIACGPNQRIMNSAVENRGELTPAPSNSNSTASASTAQSSFKEDLESMRTADFKFIVVFRRKDGAKLDSDDKGTIGRITGSHVNRRKLSDDGKAVIIGSNFPFLPGMLEELTERFRMEDHSKPDSGPLVANTSEEP